MISYNGSIQQYRRQQRDEVALSALDSSRINSDREDPHPRYAPLIGSVLTEADYTALQARWIDRNLVDRAHLRRVNSLTGADVVGRTGGDYAGILIPYFQPGSGEVREYRLRRDHPDVEYDSAGNLRERQKYLSAPGRSNMLYLPPGLRHSILRDPTGPIVITEGEFKTLALWRAANWGAGNHPRFLPAGVPGSFAWLPVVPGSGSGGRPSARHSGVTARWNSLENSRLAPDA